MLDGAAAERQDQRVPGGQPGDGGVFPLAKGGFAVAGEELGDGRAGLGLDHIVHIDEAPAKPSRRASGPTVVLPEPMKPVSTMRRGGSCGAGCASRDWSVAVMRPLRGSPGGRVLSIQYREAAIRNIVPRQPRTITTAPAVISKPPASAGAVSFSPSSSQAKTITSGTLSLSSGATREAGPSCRARK